MFDSLLRRHPAGRGITNATADRLPFLLSRKLVPVTGTDAEPAAIGAIERNIIAEAATRI